MSKIYDALVQAAKNRHTRTVALRASTTGQKAKLLNLSSRNISLEWKITGIVASVILVFGVFVLIVGNQLLARALRNQIDQRTLVVTINLSDAAASPIVGNDILQLYASLTKYAQLQGVAYAFVEDRDGKIIANSIRPSPTELMGTSRPDERKQVDRRAVTIQGKTVYETRVPILEGQLGAVHLGIWAEDVKKEINTLRLTFVGVTLLLLLVAAVLSVFFMRAIMLPIGGQTGLPSQISGPGELKPRLGKYNRRVNSRISRLPRK
jgi:two-component system, cell cycle sensor histidine kinase and response regulator CckA